MDIERVSGRGGHNEMGFIETALNVIIRDKKENGEGFHWPFGRKFNVVVARAALGCTGSGMKNVPCLCDIACIQKLGG